MSFVFDLDTKERVRAATDIVDLVGTRLELRRQGRNYVALCPWHRDSRPSLQVNAEKQIWKCWVCDIGGDAFTFLMQADGLTFGEALKSLAERAGIPLQQNQGRGGKSKSFVDTKSDAFRALDWASKWFQRQLKETAHGKRALEYMAERGFTNEMLERFGVGLSPNSWSALQDDASKQKLSMHVLEAAGLVGKKERGGYYDFFRGRIMFPIRDREKRTIAFGGRILPGEEGAKYINSRETQLFQKSKQLYGFDLASGPMRHSRRAIVMEGYTDVMFAHQCGVDDSVAVLGTALGAAHLRMLRHYCDKVILLLDGDAAGQRRSDDVLELFLHAQMDVRVLTLPDGLDPADYLQKHGKEHLNELIANAADALEFKMRRSTEGFDPLLDTHRANQAVEEMLDLLAKVPHSGLISNDQFRLRQNQVLPRLARKFSIPEDSLRQRLTELRTKQSRMRPRRDQNEEESRPTMRPGDLSPFERELLELIIVAPQVAPIALERVQSGWLECEAARHMLAAYQELEFSGESLEFDNVLTNLEDSTLKSLLVTLHEQANAKLQFTQETAENRLRVLTHRMGERQDALRRQAQETQLQKNQYSEEEELDVLLDVIRQAKLRQGIVEGTKPATENPGEAEAASNTAEATETEEGNTDEQSDVPDQATGPSTQPPQ
ncbi:MAG: hypothetical protein Aurels2KO_29470 [Aureliella sp.]